MVDHIKKSKVILREERKSRDYRFLSAEINENGDLVFVGQDLGDSVEGAYGYTEYEWCWTVKEAEIPKLQNAIGENGEVLNLLEKYFSKENADSLYMFLQEHNVEFTSWSRIGD
ncbi:hypothetical protein [Shewanella psychrotolerans]|uniref:hypothetical protein n=1 Tax=Shewanella psychrotolerans TaxID=2864206 RepID=UPI001C654C02|nr:hypothetical protein [Shewanella psychrotolerans]QYK01058.1 hypothetical protein K0I62_17025 [Shewanella psychrotolerans]